jgi:hypothetical protein
MKPRRPYRFARSCRAASVRTPLRSSARRRVRSRASFFLANTAQTSDVALAATQQPGFEMQCLREVRVTRGARDARDRRLHVDNLLSARDHISHMACAAAISERGHRRHMPVDSQHQWHARAVQCGQHIAASARAVSNSQQPASWWQT